MVKVEGEFRIVKVRILLHISVIVQLGGIFERLHGSDFVLRLDVAVSHLVVGDLSERVSAVRHHAVVFDGAFVVFQRVEK